MAERVLIVITGPTAVGKTDLCLEIAERYNIPIINADSRQIYRNLKIGTAAPTEEQQKRIKHYFVGTLGLNDYYNASMYEQDVLDLTNRLFLAQEKKGIERPVLLLTGGSMMYIDAVCNGIDDIPTIRNDVRDMIKEKFEREGLSPILEELKSLDPEYYDFVDKNNTRRVIHGLEICIQTGKTYTSFRKNEKRQRPFKVIKIGLNREREELYRRINNRVDSMIAEGLEHEARQLTEYRDTNALNTVGYKEMFAYFDGTYSLNEAIERIKGNTRRYARKQLTWYKRDQNMHWFNPDNKDDILNYISLS
ncbi:tRNA (adenosine(37)-N6)-dimethylallyltransferase MiaA [Xylanibacter muris]|uniref:tRNA dimethylallyltransferase n=1 Tax=Xylanibacter muris TaxID=2736290 RepID=A0ABX2ALF5_9BACT|nr:tRNA (adenosine(37)-N6)-dimethylallyltransferase MiaA [Xylanibacter muris]NPD91427.1 tRNA (adenosine(37)-N6)-dimethylallyltransferase MiaA [Xylanibacter muris]